MNKEFDEKWQQMQIENWKNDTNEIVSFFNRFNINIENLYKHVTSVDYDRMQKICYLLSKIDKVIKICDFLDTLERDDHEDVDVIKIYTLVSHAEITSRSFGEKGKKIELVKKFFHPVEPELKYRIVPSLPSIGHTPNIDFADILYKIRCEYTHEGNYTGRIFKRNKDGARSLLFSYRDKNQEYFGECGIIYKEFLDLYMTALVENIKTFSEYPR